ncbi:hypothetical protein Tco_1086996 [Tanacetum coccineum]
MGRTRVKLSGADLKQALRLPDCATACSRSGEYHQGTGYSLKDKNKATNDKTKHGMEEHEKDKVKSKPKSKKVKVNRSQSQPRDTALERASKTEPELMGRMMSFEASQQSSTTSTTHFLYKGEEDKVLREWKEEL